MLQIDAITDPIVVLSLEGYFHYARQGIYYRSTPFDLLDFSESTDAVRVDLLHDDKRQYRLLIEGEKYGQWSVMLDKTAYWWFPNGIWISETPIRQDDGHCVEPQIRLDLGFDTTKKYRLQWIQMP